MLPRTDSMVKPPITQANYKPNKEYVMENTIKGLADFKKFGGRNN